jgi:hypothetical protein
MRKRIKKGPRHVFHPEIRTKDKQRSENCNDHGKNTTGLVARSGKAILKSELILAIHNWRVLCKTSSTVTYSIDCEVPQVSHSQRDIQKARMR